MLEEALQTAQDNVRINLQIAMRQRHITQKELAKLLHTSEAQISDAVAGDASPLARQLRQRMYQILDIK